MLCLGRSIESELEVIFFLRKIISSFQLFFLIVPAVWPTEESLLENKEWCYKVVCEVLHVRIEEIEEK